MPHFQAVLQLSDCSLSHHTFLVFAAVKCPVKLFVTVSAVCAKAV